MEGHVRIARGHYFDSTGEHLGTKAIVLEHSPAESLLPTLHAAATTSATCRSGSPTRRPASTPSRSTTCPPSVDRPTSYDGYLDRRIDEWRRTALDHVESEPFLRYVAAWLDAHRPPARAAHLDPRRLPERQHARRRRRDLVLLDWELAQVGDPREDLGYFKAVAQADAARPHRPRPEAFCARYRELTGFDEAQVNPAVITYFLILGRDRHGAAAARGWRRLRPR